MKSKLMAILNVTPDSFYGRQPTYQQAIDTALRFQNEGADILDIGGESTRPGSLPITEAEELERVIPVIETLRGKLTIPISIDTTKPAIARAAIQAGAIMINDVTGFRDPEMIDLAAETKLDLCVMHMLGTPKTMQQNPHYEGGIVPFLLQWFEKKVEALMAHGIDPDKIILDPGIGFGKTVADNLEIIHNLREFKRLGFRVLLGLSRKSFMTRILNKPPEELLPATIAMNVMGIAGHADIIRVHDVKEHRTVIDVMEAYLTHQ